MPVATENSLYYLIVQGREDDAIFIFLGADPAQDSPDAPIAVPVTLELLPARQRFGGAGIAMGLPILGRWPGGVDRFRQFVSLLELEQAGWLPVPRYRICDCWDDYYSPWASPPKDPSNECASADRRGTAEDVDTEDDLDCKKTAFPPSSALVDESIPTRGEFNNGDLLLIEEIVPHMDTGYASPTLTSMTEETRLTAEQSNATNSVSPPESSANEMILLTEDEFNLSVYSIDLGR